MPNPVQIEYATKVAQCFEAGSKQQTSIGLIKAAPESARHWDMLSLFLLMRPFWANVSPISTYTIQLQFQMLSDGGDIVRQVIFELTGRRLTVSPRLGLRNFVSPLGILASLATKGITEPLEAVKKFINWAETSKTGMFLEWSHELYANLVYRESSGVLLLISGLFDAIDEFHAGNDIS